MRIVLITLCISTLLTACGGDTAKYQSDVYDASQVNKRQELKIVNILTVTPAKIMVDNRKNQKTAQGIGAILGAILGGTTTDSAEGFATGAIAGGWMAQVVPDDVLVEGVSIVYQQDDGRVLTSAQIGKLCQFALGTGMMIISEAEETRIQSNHTCIKGQENVVGIKSNISSHVFAGLKVNADDQDALDMLKRKEVLMKQEASVTLDMLKRKEVLMKQEASVQKVQTELNKEIRRSDQANISTDIERALKRQKVQTELNKEIRRSDQANVSTDIELALEKQKVQTALNKEKRRSDQANISVDIELALEKQKVQMELNKEKRRSDQAGASTGVERALKRQKVQTELNKEIRRSDQVNISVDIELALEKQKVQMELNKEKRRSDQAGASTGVE